MISTFLVRSFERKIPNYIGRTEFDSPEVDPEVLIDRLDGTSLIIGNFYQIEVVDSDDFDLFGKVV